MRRRNELQAVVTRFVFLPPSFAGTDVLGNRGITGSGKSSRQRLFLNQILRLSAYSKKELKLAEQIKSLETVLDSFGNAKTLMNPNASRDGRYLELHFND
jgi:chitin synthase